MTLRKKTLIIIAAILVGLIVLLYTSSQVILLGSFVQLERQSTERDVERARNVLADELAALNSTSADWGHWDDTYFFVQDGNQEYIASNLGDTTAENLSLNLMVYLNDTGEIIFEKSYDLEAGQVVPLPQDLLPHLTQDSPLLSFIALEDSTSGLLRLEEELLLVSARPILTSQKEGPATGTLIFGRYLDEAKIQQYEESTRLSLTIYPVGAAQLSADFQEVSSLLTVESPVKVQPLDDDTIAGYTLLNDVYGNPVVYLRVDTPRAIVNQGQASISYFILSLLVAGLVFGGAMLLVLERLVLARVTRLDNDVTGISKSGDLKPRVSVSGEDELATLAGAINRMLDSLAQSQQTLRDTELRLQSVIAGAPILLWALDREGVVTLVEGRSLENLGLKREALIGKTIGEIGDQLPSQIQEVGHRALKGEEVSTILSVPGGQTFDLRYTPLKDAQGTVSGVIGVATDITERILAEEALGKAHTELEQVNDRLERQNKQLERVHEFLRATLEQITDTMRLGGDKEELMSYLELVNAEFERLGDKPTLHN